MRENRPGRKELREELAALAHEQWSGWMQYLFSKCTKDAFITPRGTANLVSCKFAVPAWAADRWTRQMQTAYVDLPEEEKESDRKEADRVLAVLERHKGEEAVTETRAEHKTKTPMPEPDLWGLWGKYHWWMDDRGRPFLTKHLVEAKMMLHNIQHRGLAGPWRIRSAREWQRTLYDTSLVEEGPCASPPL